MCTYIHEYPSMDIKNVSSVVTIFLLFWVFIIFSSKKNSEEMVIEEKGKN